jgi:phage tail tape-measure protein
MSLISLKAVFRVKSSARQRPKRPAQQGHEVTEPVKAATRSRLQGEEGDAQNTMVFMKILIG